MLEDAPDVVERHVAQAGVAIAREERLSVLPERLVGVHPGAVVAKEGLRHEGRRLAVLVGDVPHDVLVQVHLVGGPQEGVEDDVDLGLPGGGDLVVLALDRYPQRNHREDHLVADVDQLVGRGHREVALLVADLVAQVGGAVVLLLAPAVPGGLDGVDLVEGRVRGAVVGDAVKDEEFGLGPEVGGVGDAGALQVGLRLLGDAAGVSVVGLLGQGIVRVAGERQGGVGGERVDEGGLGIGKDQHVGGVDRLPSPHRRAVEAEALGEHVLRQLGNRYGEVLPGPQNVAEFEVDDFDLLFLGQFDYVFGCHGV